MKIKAALVILFLFAFGAKLSGAAVNEDWRRLSPYYYYGYAPYGYAYPEYTPEPWAPRWYPDMPRRIDRLPGYPIAPRGYRYSQPRRQSEYIPPPPRYAPPPRQLVPAPRWYGYPRYIQPPQRQQRRQPEYAPPPRYAPPPVEYPNYMPREFTEKTYPAPDYQERTDRGGFMPYDYARERYSGYVPQQQQGSPYDDYYYEGTPPPRQRPNEPAYRR